MWRHSPLGKLGVITFNPFYGRKLTIGNPAKVLDEQQLVFRLIDMTAEQGGADPMAASLLQYSSTSAWSAHRIWNDTASVGTPPGCLPPLRQ